MDQDRSVTLLVSVCFVVALYQWRINGKGAAALLSGICLAVLIRAMYREYKNYTGARN